MDHREVSSPFHSRERGRLINLGEESDDDDGASEEAPGTVSRLAQLREAAASHQAERMKNEADAMELMEGGGVKTPAGSVEPKTIQSPESIERREEVERQREFMATFFKEVEEVKEGIRVVQVATKRIREITEERMMVTSSETE